MDGGYGVDGRAVAGQPVRTSDRLVCVMMIIVNLQTNPRHGIIPEISRRVSRQISRLVSRKDQIK